ncbi:SRPBCC family protein [Flavobacterium rhizosphaerae]|uniref:SRPBCC domain-containing protein n=1 Tax=Flavobacterium rhizosphaerae TaxID=3163298 RepID=A0ABW8YSE0_9FLAO
MENNIIFTKHPSGKKLVITRYFSIPLNKLWQAWTNSELLDKWWAPKPWRTETKTMDFFEGGKWLYSMLGPNGEKHWCRVDFKTIEEYKGITAIDGFCNENGKFSTDFPLMDWFITFISDEAKTKIVVEITFNTEEDLEKIVDMGFKEGFAMALDNLEEIFA